MDLMKYYGYKVNRINCYNPKSMYLFFIRVQRILSKNYGGSPPKGLRSDLSQLELDAKNYYYYDAYLEKTGGI